MSDTRKDEAIAMVERFMLASMEGDRGVTDELMSPDIEVTFVGGQELRKPEEIRAVNSRRYRNVAKSIERYDVAFQDDEIVVYSMGTLYGEWLDGEPFEGDRYIDRFVIKGGKIVRMDVWNDSAEHLLERAAERAHAETSLAR
jgi:ketosteroid isomerase-like protein